MALASAAGLALSAVVVPHVVAGPIRAEATAACPQKYVVQWGDSWSQIAVRAKISLADLLAANSGDASSPLFAGVTICLPAGATMPTTTTTTAPSDPSAPTTVPAPTTTLPPVIPIAAFPVQGNCWYTDTWQAPRGGGRRHEGVDIIAKSGQFVYAVVDGTLTRQAVDRPGSLSGNAWWLTAPNRDYFFYAHLSGFAPGLTVGSKVKAGQVIGWIGSTGSSSTPHLHFEVHPNGGRAVNPTPTVRAVDGCRTTRPLPQPGGAPPPTMPPPTTTTTTPATTTTKPAPVTTTPATTTKPPAPSTAPPPTQAPPTTRPAAVCAQTYNVQRGDGWLLIASKNGISLNALLAANNLSSASAQLFAGSTICLRTAPAPTTVPVTTAPATTAPTTTAPATTVAPPPTAPPPTAPPPSGASRWQFMAPQTAFDSAWANQPLAAGVRHTLRVDRARGVPATTTGVVVRLTATSAGGAGYLVSFPCDAPTPPTVSHVSFEAGETAVGTTMVEVVGGSVCVAVSSAAHVKVEVLATEGPAGVGVQPVPARRVLDTRTTARLEPGVRVPISPAALGVVSGTQALTASITVVDPAGAGTLSLGFCNAGPWTPPITAESISSFSMTMRVNSSGWCVSSSVPTHLIVDVNAVWAGSSAPRTVDPARVFDSRSTSARVASRQVVVLVAGRNGVPATATAAVLSITTVTGMGAASVFVVPCGQRPNSGTVTAQTAGEVITGAAVVGLGSGAVCISATNPADVIVDVVGFV